MKNSIHKLLIAAAVIAGTALASLGLLIPAQPASAAPMAMAPAADQPKGSETKGRYYFRQTCKNCHTKGAAGGEITPLNKTQAQWKAYFVAAKHNHGKEPLSKVMSEDQIRDVATFLREHASDSLQPETCGK
jgi:mono/diheme cytochrome c family protein